MKRCDKNGQFYLLAAIVIVAIILGFATVSNYAKTKSDIKIYDLGEELGIEGGEVLDYGTVQGDVFGDDDLMLHFTTIYDEYVGSDKEVYYIFGNRESIVAQSYEEVVAGTISLNIGDGSSELDIPKRESKTLDSTTLGDKIKVTIPEISAEYEFDLNEGENFYFVIAQGVGDETYVASG